MATALARLVRAATDELSADDVLRELCRVTAQALSCDAVGVMAVDGAGTRFLTATDSRVEAAEIAQEGVAAGPCRDSLVTRRTVIAFGSVELRRRWPDFAAAADGIQSVISVPLVARGRCWGVLDLFGYRPEPLDEREADDAALLADVAVSALVMASDREEARAAQRALAEELLHDELTGLPNRVLLQELISHALLAAERHGTSVAVLFVDVDRFKGINDAFGHQAGDLVLRAVAERMKRVTRAADTLARISGDEFVVLCEDVADAVDPQRVVGRLAERIRRAVSAVPVPIDGGGPAPGASTVDVTVSVGAAVTHTRMAAGDLLHQADLAMYSAKLRGRDTSVVVRADGIIDRADLGRRLLEALPRGEFRVFYQPVVTADARIVAVEALLRWQHPDRGLLDASEFIELAASSGAIVPIGHWVIDQALAQLRDWTTRFSDRAPALVFCNLSPREVVAPELLGVVERSLLRHDLPPDRLGLEITEASLADPRLAATLAQFQALGHPLAIDDFGTGYSSLARLVTLPAAYVKLDRSLVATLPDDARSRALVEAVLIIAEKLKLQVISEGVETPAQADWLTAAGCGLQQGWRHGGPVCADGIDELLRPA